MNTRARSLSVSEWHQHRPTPDSINGCIVSRVLSLNTINRIAPVMITRRTGNDCCAQRWERRRGAGQLHNYCVIKRAILRKQNLDALNTLTHAQHLWRLRQRVCVPIGVIRIATTTGGCIMLASARLSRHTPFAVLHLLRRLRSDLSIVDPVDRSVDAVRRSSREDCSSVDQLLSVLHVRGSSMFRSYSRVSSCRCAWPITARENGAKIAGGSLTRIQSVSSLVFFETWLFSILRSSFSAFTYHSWTWPYSLRYLRRWRSALSRRFFDPETWRRRNSCLEREMNDQPWIRDGCNWLSVDRSVELNHSVHRSVSSRQLLDLSEWHIRLQLWCPTEFCRVSNQKKNSQGSMSIDRGTHETRLQLIMNDIGIVGTDFKCGEIGFNFLKNLTHLRVFRFEIGRLLKVTKLRL